MKRLLIALIIILEFSLALVSATTQGSDPRQSRQEKDETYWKGQLTCTDQNGITFHRSQKGFDRCVQMKLHESQQEEDQTGHNPPSSSPAGTFFSF